jgi:hypothetical protein
VLEVEILCFVSCDDGAEDNSKSPNNSIDGEEEEQREDGDQSSNSTESLENEDQAEQGRLEFPDTEIKIEHVKGSQ